MTSSSCSVHLLDTSKKWNGLHFHVPFSPFVHLVKKMSKYYFLESPIHIKPTGNVVTDYVTSLYVYFFFKKKKHFETVMTFCLMSCVPETLITSILNNG